MSPVIRPMDQYNSQSALDLTIKQRGGPYALKNIDLFVIDQNTITPRDGLLKIHDIYKAMDDSGPLKYQVAIGSGVVDFEFLLRDPVGRAAIEDRFTLNKVGFGQNEIAEIASEWGFVPIEQNKSAITAWKVGSVVFWGPSGHQKAYDVSDLTQTKAGRLLLDIASQDSDELKHSLGLPNMPVQRSRTIQTIQLAARTCGQRYAWYRLPDLISTERSSDTNSNTDLRIHDIWCADPYNSPADLLVRFGPWSLQLAILCNTGIGRAAVVQLFYEVERATHLPLEVTRGDRRNFSRLVRETVHGWTAITKKNTPAFRIMHYPEEYEIVFGDGDGRTYNKRDLKNGPIAEYLVKSWTVVDATPPFKGSHGWAPSPASSMVSVHSNDSHQTFFMPRQVYMQTQQNDGPRDSKCTNKERRHPKVMGPSLWPPQDQLPNAYQQAPCFDGNMRGNRRIHKLRRLLEKLCLC